MANIFEKENLERLKFVVVTGGTNPKVKMSFTGIESMAYGSILFNRIPLTAKGVIRVFGQDDSYRGYIKKNENGLPKKYLPDTEDKDTTFKDWFTIVE